MSLVHPLIFSFFPFFSFFQNSVTSQKSAVIHICSLDYIFVAKFLFHFSSQCVGSGGFGEVRVANWPARQIQVALKTILTDREDDFLALQREARYLCICRHPNIVPMHGLTQLGPGRHALVMEFAAGGSLNLLLARRAVCSPAVLLDWAQQIARGMCYLHEDAPARIYHRDLKSSNGELPGTVLYTENRFFSKRLYAHITKFNSSMITYRASSIKPLGPADL